MLRNLLLILLSLIIIISHSSESHFYIIDGIYSLLSNENEDQNLALIIFIRILYFLPLISVNIILSIWVFIFSEKKITDKLLFSVITLKYGWLGYILFLTEQNRLNEDYLRSKFKKIIPFLLMVFFMQYLGTGISVFIFNITSEYNSNDLEISSPKMQMIYNYLNIITHLSLAIFISFSFSKRLKNSSSKSKTWIFMTLVSGVIPWLVFNSINSKIIDNKNEIE